MEKSEAERRCLIRFWFSVFWLVGYSGKGNGAMIGDCCGRGKERGREVRSRVELGSFLRPVLNEKIWAFSLLLSFIN
jgi:hypothetical protein